MRRGNASGPGRGGQEARRADARRAAGAGSTRRVAPVEPARRDTGRPAARRNVGNRVGDAHGAPRRVSAAAVGSRARIVASPVRGRFAVEDSQGTVLAIQDEWKRGKRSKNVLDACARIDAFLDNPLLVDDEARAAATVQRIARGWLLRRARTRGALLFPVEAQALADGRVLMHNHYGARIYSMGPAERRRLVTEHWAARRLQRMFGRLRRAAAAGHGDPCASPRPEPSFFSVGPDDSLLVCSPRESCEGLLHGATGVQQAAHAAGVQQPRGAAALRLQACWRGAACRLRARLYRASRAGAAVVLQKTFRGWLCRRRIERLQQRVLMKRALGLWNKVMWTVYSPGRRCVGYDLTPSTGQYGGCAVDCEPAAASTPVHTNLSAAMDIEEDDAVMQETPRDVAAQTLRQSWRVEPGMHAEQCGALARGGPAHAVAQTHHAQTQWPDTYTRSMCFEPGALAEAVAMDSSAVRIQRAVRAYLSGTRVGSLHRAGDSAGKLEPVLNEPAGPSHATPPGGGPAIQGGGINAGASLAADGARGGAGAGLGSASSPVRSTPPSPALPPATPVLAGTGCEREQVLSAWKKGIETQVSIIHEKLVDSARKGSSARSRSRSPPPPPSAAGSSKPLLVGAASRPSCSPVRSSTSSPALSPPETPSNVFRGPGGDNTEHALRGNRLVPCLPLQREPRTPDKALSGDEDELAACGARHGTGSSGRASRAATCTRSPCVASPVKVPGKRATGTGSAGFQKGAPAPGRPSSFQRACELDGEAIKMAALPALQL